MDDISQLLRMRNNPRYQHRQCCMLERVGFRQVRSLLIALEIERFVRSLVHLPLWVENQLTINT